LLALNFSIIPVSGGIIAADDTAVHLLQIFM